MICQKNYFDIGFMKIGISTHYYKSNNYGGNLQAYALCQVLKKMGYDVEQICFQSQSYINQKKSYIVRFKIFIYNIVDFLIHPIHRIFFLRRIKAVYAFNHNLIPHSSEIYSLKTLSKVEGKYDLFITGSDIVWGPNVHSPFFFLNFLSSKAKKMSYAASLGTDSLTDKQKIFFKNDLETYVAISVREKSVIPLLEETIARKVDYCVDPTLLLDTADWNKICSKRLIDKSYIFCYFLGNNIKAVKCAQEYAKSHNLKLVNIPYLTRFYKKTNDFGDIKLSKVSPCDFLSLIKYANTVFTDSFHACVFSSIYKTNFFAFRRSQDDSLGVRILDFITTLNLLPHYCCNSEKENIEYIDTVGEATYLKQSELSIIIDQSKDYLRLNIEKAFSI